MELPDFDTLRELHSTDPEALENLRQRLIEEVIDSTPPDFQRRLRGIQFQVDSCLRLRSNYISRCIFVSQLMHQSAAELLRSMNDIKTLGSPSQPAQNDGGSSHQSSNIIPFALRPKQ